MKVEARGVVRRFGEVTALDHVSFTAEAGKVLSILGPSGCGKTTMLKVVAGLLKVDEGRILFDGVDVTDVPPQERNTGFVLQSLALFPNLTVRDNVGFPLDARGWSYELILKRVKEMLQLTRLEGLEDRYPRQLSGGQQQRVALARALAAETKLLLLDEPLASLDVNLRSGLLHEIKRIQRNTGVTTIYVTHDQSEAFAVSDKVAVMFEGRIEAFGDVHAIYMKPPTRRIAEFVGATNVLKCVVQDSDGRRSRVRVGDLVLDIDYACVSGSTVTLLVRPESITIASGRTASPTFPGVVTEVMFLGKGVKTRVETEIGTIESVSYEPDSYLELKGMVGQKVNLAIDSRGVILVEE